MGVALFVFVASLGLGVLGMLLPDMYVVGLLMMIVGGIGVLVRSVDWIRWLRQWSSTH